MPKLSFLVGTFLIVSTLLFSIIGASDTEEQTNVNYNSSRRDNSNYNDRTDSKTDNYNNNNDNYYNSHNNNHENNNFNHDSISNHTQYNENNNSTSNSQNSTTGVDLSIKDSKTGLTMRTMNRISKLPRCKQNALLNYHQLLHRPDVRLQFFRDLYQRKQKNEVRGCGRLKYRDRAVLLRDPYFRRIVYRMMKAQSSLSSAILKPS